MKVKMWIRVSLSTGLRGRKQGPNLARDLKRCGQTMTLEGRPKGSPVVLGRRL